MDQRRALANQICAGLAGWHQLQDAQNLGGLSGEDSARLLISQIVNAQGRFSPATSQLPANWGATKKRIDVALKGRSENSSVWYGAIEVKWPGNAFDQDQVRLQLVQDAMRLTFVEATNVNAKFLVLGGSKDSIDTLFDKVHRDSEEREDRRAQFCNLFSRNIASPKRHLAFGIWSQTFPKAGARIPEGVFNDFSGRLKTELLAQQDSVVAGEMIGQVFVWQCRRTKGSASQNTQ